MKENMYWTQTHATGGITLGNTVVKLARSGWMLIRFIAVISSSIVVVLSSLLPFLLYTSVPFSDLLFTFLLLSMTAVLFHGVLTHLFNDHTDHLTGTDAKSPAQLSGGSRVIQQGLLLPKEMWKLGKWLTIAMTIVAAFFAIFGRYDLTIFILVGIWAATSYSLSPFRLSYRPFLGEWLSLFPALFTLGIAGPWLVSETLPVWAIQNAFMNSLICMSWVMVHHMPDVEADRQAIPKKRTTVVWFKEKFGLQSTRMPALLYLILSGLGAIWIGFERIAAAAIVFVLILFAMYFVVTMNPEKVHQITKYEKYLLILAILIAVVLGVFVS